MAREKKDGRHINLYIEREIIESLEKYCERMKRMLGNIITN